MCESNGLFTPGKADMARKALGKCKRDVLECLHDEFVSHGESLVHGSDCLEKIWSEMESTGMYAFNKSHAVCYTWLA